MQNACEFTWPEGHVALRAYGGGLQTGLGLSISRKSVGANGGAIKVRNMPGKGCVFTLNLPLAR